MHSEEIKLSRYWRLTGMELTELIITCINHVNWSEFMPVTYK